MRLTPPRPMPGEDYFLACVTFSSKVDGFRTEHRCYCGSWLSLHRWIRSFGPGRMQVQVYAQGKEEVGRCLVEFRRQSALHQLLLQAQANN
jgi:hypothetical protein